MPRNSLPVVKQLALLALVLLLILGWSVIPDYSKEDDDRVAISIEKSTPRSQRISLLQDEIEGESAFVWDTKEERVLYEKNPDSVRALASLTKLMTLLLVYELEKLDGEIDEYEIEELADLTLLSSSNHGAELLASAIGSQLTDNNAYQAAFVSAMNLRAEELGLHSLSFYNPTGLDLDNETAGSYGTAREVAFLLEHIIDNIPEVTERSKEKSFVFTDPLGQTYETLSTNQDVDKIPGIIASKTGYTKLAGGNLAIAIDVGVNHPIVIVVLGSSEEGRFRDVKLLSDAVYKLFATS